VLVMDAYSTDDGRFDSLRSLNDRGVIPRSLSEERSDSRAPGTRYFVIGAKRSLNDASSVTPFTSAPVTAT
jgi:hypothetical protein